MSFRYGRWAWFYSFRNYKFWSSCETRVVRIRFGRSPNWSKRMEPGPVRGAASLTRENGCSTFSRNIKAKPVWGVSRLGSTLDKELKNSSLVKDYRSNLSRSCMGPRAFVLIEESGFRSSKGAPNLVKELEAPICLRKLYVQPRSTN